MAKISNTLKDFKELVNGIKNIDVFYSSLQTNDQKFREFISIFDSVEDSRMINKCKYTVSTIVGIVFMGILSNMDTWIEIEAFARKKKEVVGKYVDLSNGIPSHDTLVRVFGLIKSETLEDALVTFIQDSIKKVISFLNDENSFDLLTIDGKSQNGSGRSNTQNGAVRNTQTLNLYNPATGVTIKSKLIEEKTNEIPVAQAILRTINVKGVIISTDAMNCQKETVKVIKEEKAHYVLGLKGNHGGFHNEIEEAFNQPFKKTSTNYYEMEVEKNHNQVEKREYYMINANKLLYADEWEGINNVVMAKKITTNNFTGEEKEERRYYISDLKDVELISEAIRRHWAIENELHWHLDVTLNEDENTTMNKRAVHNLSIMKKNILTMLKLLQPLFGKVSLKTTRKLFALNYEENIMKLFSLLDSQNIEELIKNK